MTFVDYYQILGLMKTATAADIKKSYRKLARILHPDLNPDVKDAQKNFQLINEANEVLSDPEKRKKYDQYGKNWEHGEEFEKQQKQQQQSAKSHRESYSEQQSQGNFSSFFESMFGGTSGASRSRRASYSGEDYTTELQLTLLEASKSHTQIITVNGKKIRITIPAGIENGQTIKIAGHGGTGINGGTNGDLYITITIAVDPVFKRMGNNLYASVNIDLCTAVLGGEITLQTLTGKVKLKVAPETQIGSKIKLSHKGFPVYKKEGTFGDLVITYSVKIPTNLTVKQKELFSELSKTKEGCLTTTNLP